MWMIFSSSLMNLCISIKIMYKKYYYDFKKLTQIDIDKCEFEVKSIKYLKFILKVEKSVQMNSQKVEAIMNWQALSQ
jgi:hypothetical protein